MNITIQGDFASTHKVLTHTPWGSPDFINAFAPGIAFYATPSHGGYLLNPEQNAKVAAWFRTGTFHYELPDGSGWYEEDCDCVKVMITFPEHFPSKMLAAACKMALDFNYCTPDQLRIALMGGVCDCGATGCVNCDEAMQDDADFAKAVVASTRTPEFTAFANAAWDRHPNNPKNKKSEAGYTTIASVIMLGLAGFMLLMSLGIFQMAQRRSVTVVCESGTQRLVSEGNEYPAWELECRNQDGSETSVRVIVVD